MNTLALTITHNDAWWTLVILGIAALLVFIFRNRGRIL